MKRARARGFTLIEVLVALAIVAIAAVDEGRFARLSGAGAGGGQDDEGTALVAPAYHAAPGAKLLDHLLVVRLLAHVLAHPVTCSHRPHRERRRACRTPPLDLHTFSQTPMRPETGLVREEGAVVASLASAVFTSPVMNDA